jgi:hypothetical protein
MILPVESFNDANMHIWPEDILKQIKKGRGEWEAGVPEVVAAEIISRGLFGFDTG